MMGLAVLGAAVTLMRQVGAWRELVTREAVVAVAMLLLVETAALAS
jgi:hypothetical protein